MRTTTIALGVAVLLLLTALAAGILAIVLGAINGNVWQVGGGVVLLGCLLILVLVPAD